jgi:hypothetical protein
MVFIVIAIRLLLFIIIMKSLHFLIRWAFSMSFAIGAVTCLIIIGLCFLAAAVVDGRLGRRRARPLEARKTKAPEALGHQRES